jgi:hypothetical protein
VLTYAGNRPVAKNRAPARRGAEFVNIPRSSLLLTESPRLECIGHAAVQLVELVTAKWTAKIILQDEGERCVVVDKHHQRLQDVEKAIILG